MADPFNWHCPHCDHKVTISGSHYSSDTHRSALPSGDGLLAVHSEVITCPNSECRKVTISASIKKWEPVNSGGFRWVGEPIAKWRLLPFGASKVFPDYVPSPIRDDYKEACLIRDLSPKSAAALARRTLQGILRDFYKVKAGRLVDEIDALEETMEPELLDAIHGVRKVGNIGAHMEADINVIVDVDSGEAQLLIELVETMIEETYVRRSQRAARLARVTQMANFKEAERKGSPAGAIPPPAKPA